MSRTCRKSYEDGPLTPNTEIINSDSDSTTLLTPSPYHLLDHEYGKTPQNQIIPNPLTSPLQTQNVKRQLNLETFGNGFEDVASTPMAVKRIRQWSSSSASNKSTCHASTGNKYSESPSRYFTSLGALTKNFIGLIAESSDGLIDINLASEKLDIKKRRIYDITNVLEGVGVLEKKSKSLFQWKCRDMFESLTSSTQNDIDLLKAKEEELDNLIKIADQDIKQSYETEKYGFITYEDIRNVESLSHSNFLIVKAPPETQLQVSLDNSGEEQKLYMKSSKGEVEVFFCPNYDPDSTQSQLKPDISQNVSDLLVDNTVIKSPEKLSAIKQSPTCLNRKHKLVIPESSELMQNEENTMTITMCKEELSSEQKYKPSTNGSAGNNYYSERPAAACKKISLDALTKKLIGLLDESSDGVIDLNLASEKLNVKKRRINDITHVLEVMGLLKRTSKKPIQWQCSDMFESYINNIQNDIELMEAKKDELDNFIKNAVARNKYSESPTSYHSTSIGVLTKKFIGLVAKSSDGVIDINLASEQLDVKKRRIYNITYVLEGIGVLEKKSKSHIQWKCRNMFESYINNTQNDIVLTKAEEEEELDNLIKNAAKDANEITGDPLLVLEPINELLNDADYNFCLDPNERLDD